MTSVQSQYMFCPPLAFKTAWTQQQPKSLHSGTSPEKPDRDSKRNSIKCPRSPTNMDTVRNLLRENGLRVRRPYFGAVLRPRHRFARVRSCNRVRGWDLQNWRRVWFSDESKFILQKRDGVHVSTNAGIKGSQGSVMMPYPTPENLNWCASSATLTPLDTDMRFWHHTCCPQWTSVWKFFSTTTFGRTQFVLLLTF